MKSVKAKCVKARVQIRDGSFQDFKVRASGTNRLKGTGIVQCTASGSQRAWERGCFNLFCIVFIPGNSQYKRSNASFLFSLRNPSNLAPFKCPIINGKNGNAIYCDPSYGATFGGGRDLYISSNANTDQNSYSNLGNTYQPPPGYQYATQQTESLLAGSLYFQPTEIEVFYWIMTTDG